MNINICKIINITIYNVTIQYIFSSQNDNIPTNTLANVANMIFFSYSINVIKQGNKSIKPVSR